MKHREKIAFAKVVFTTLVVCGLIGYFLASLTSNQTHETPYTTDITTTKPSIDVVLTKRMETLIATYDSTMRNCYGKFCFDESVKIDSHNKIDRVGLLAIPQSGGELILQLIGHVGEGFELIDTTLTSNVPCYGYGKNHGWTRLVRIARRLLPHALSLVANVDNATVLGTTNALLDSQIKQLVRWHCRVSHVAAHTKVLTIFVEDLLARPVVELEKILTFIGVKYSRPALSVASSSFSERLVKHLSGGISKYSVQKLESSGTPLVQLSDGSSTGASGSTTVLYEIPREYVFHMLEALESELHHSNGLTKWPCASLRDLGSSAGPKQQSVSRSTLALFVPPEILAANCSDPFVRCSVVFDNSGG